MAAQPVSERASETPSSRYPGRGALPWWAWRWVLPGTALAVAVCAQLFVFGGWGAVSGNLGSLAEVRGLLQPDGAARDVLLTQAGHRFQGALRWNPRNAWAYHNLGLIYLAWGQKVAAQEAFEQAVRLRPQGQPAHFQLGRLYDEKGEAERAIAAWQEAGAAAWLVRAGVDCQEQGDAACAERYYELAVAVQSDSPDAYYRLGVLQAGLGRKVKAAEAYERALTLESERSPRRYLIEARVRALEAQWAEAIAAYQRAIALNRYDAEPYEQVGAILQEELIDPETAVEWYEAAIAADPERLGPYLRLAALRQTQRDYGQAELWYRQALEHAGDNPAAMAEIQSGLSRCALAQGRLAAARQAAEAAVEAQPAVAGYQVLLGDVYAEVKQYRLAIDSYRAALALEPGNRRAEEQLKELGWHEP